MRNLILRILSALVMAGVALAALWTGGYVWLVLLAIGGILAAREWIGLARALHLNWPAAVAAGILWLAPILLALSWLRLDLADGFWMTLYVLVVVAATDTGGYVFGRTIGGPKLLPRISPKKTWAGLGGAILFGAAAGEGISRASGIPWIMGEGFLTGPAFIGGVLVIVSQAGDFFESWLKRRAGLKDSGHLIPGHGGLLDRIDGLLFAAPVFVLAVICFT
ncbi:MAG: phosphatidate cytidylyltransferase [Pseudomonadota bacterium]|nr:phosphatidate cytidylyltransferase [Pseudomonadota bacterium]